ncbi:hypothetical protein ACLOJK_017465 [Asimina triloba]
MTSAASVSSRLYDYRPRVAVSSCLCDYRPRVAVSSVVPSPLASVTTDPELPSPLWCHLLYDACLFYASCLCTCRGVVVFSSNQKNSSLLLPARSSHCFLLCAADGTNPSPCMLARSGRYHLRFQSRSSPRFSRFKLSVRQWGSLIPLARQLDPFGVATSSIWYKLGNILDMTHDSDMNLNLVEMNVDEGTVNVDKLGGENENTIYGQEHIVDRLLMIVNDC